MLDSLLPTLKIGDNLRFCEGSSDLEARGTGWFVSVTAELPVPRAMVMVTSIESQGSLSPVKVGSVLPLQAENIEIVV